MLRKCLEILGLIESTKVPDEFLRRSSCETLDSLVLMQALDRANAKVKKAHKSTQLKSSASTERHMYS